MKKFLTILLCAFLGVGAMAQTKQDTPKTKTEHKAKEVSQNGKTFTVKESQRGNGGTPGVNTGYFLEKGGVKYPIYKSSKGSLYIEKVSKKTGNTYKQYLNKEEYAYIYKALGLN